MNFAQAKNVAWLEARKHKQPMFVVQKGKEFFAASNLDLQRQFNGIEPLFFVEAK